MTSDDPTMLYRNLDSTGHDTDDPLSHLNLLDTALLARTIRCEHCAVTYGYLPMPGNGWVLDVQHEDHCPEHEDNQPAPERVGTPGG